MKQNLVQKALTAVTIPVAFGLSGCPNPSIKVDTQIEYPTSQKLTAELPSVTITRGTIDKKGRKFRDYDITLNTRINGNDSSTTSAATTSTASAIPEWILTGGAVYVLDNYQ